MVLATGFQVAQYSRPAQLILASANNLVATTAVAIGLAVFSRL